jgi:hypothetical protein
MFFNNKTDTSMVALLTKSNQVYVVNTKSNKNLKGRIGGKFYPLDSVML